MNNPHAHVPNPLPDQEIGEEGYEMWCLAAEYRPKWLASLQDPHRYFSQMQTRYNEIVDEQFGRLIVPEPTRAQSDLALGMAHATARRSIVASMPAREVDDPVWDHLDPMEDPALDEATEPLGSSQNYSSN